MREPVYGAAPVNRPVGYICMPRLQVHYTCLSLTPHRLPIYASAAIALCASTLPSQSARLCTSAASRRSESRSQPTGYLRVIEVVIQITDSLVHAALDELEGPSNDSTGREGNGRAGSGVVRWLLLSELVIVELDCLSVYRHAVTPILQLHTCRMLAIKSRSEPLTTIPIAPAKSLLSATKIASPARPSSAPSAGAT